MGKLVVGDLRLLKEPGASAISVTAEQWVRKRPVLAALAHLCPRSPSELHQQHAYSALQPHLKKQLRQYHDVEPHLLFCSLIQSL